MVTSDQKGEKYDRFTPAGLLPPPKLNLKLHAATRLLTQPDKCVRDDRVHPSAPTRRVLLPPHRCGTAANWSE